MWKYIEKAAVMCIVAAVGAAMTFGAAPTKSANADGTLVWSIPAAQSLLDPMQACGWLTKNTTHMIFDGLVELELGKPEQPWATLRPALAETWSISDDGTVYTFNLRKGVKFHNGAEFNAQAAIPRLTTLGDPTSEGGTINYTGA